MNKSKQFPLPVFDVPQSFKPGSKLELERVKELELAKRKSFRSALCVARMMKRPLNDNAVRFGAQGNMSNPFWKA
jgi:hypothetical protein